MGHKKYGNLMKHIDGPIFPRHDQSTLNLIVVKNLKITDYLSQFLGVLNQIWRSETTMTPLFVSFVHNRWTEYRTPNVNIGQIPQAANTFRYSGVVCHTWLTHMAQFALVGYQSASGASDAVVTPAGVNSPRVNIDHIPLNTCQNFKQISSSMMSRVSR